MKKEYKIPVVWQMMGYVEVEADSLAEAKQMALDGGLPDGNYLDESFEIDDTVEIEEQEV